MRRCDPPAPRSGCRCWEPIKCRALALTSALLTLVRSFWVRREGARRWWRKIHRWSCRLIRGLTSGLEEKSIRPIHQAALNFLAPRHATDPACAAKARGGFVRAACDRLDQSKWGCARPAPTPISRLSVAWRATSKNSACRPGSTEPASCVAKSPDQVRARGVLRESCRGLKLVSYNLVAFRMICVLDRRLTTGLDNRTKPPVARILCILVERRLCKAR